MKIRFKDPFLHITATGTLVLTIITGGGLGIFYAFLHGLSLGFLMLNAKERKQEAK